MPEPEESNTDTETLVKNLLRTVARFRGISITELAKEEGAESPRALYRNSHQALIVLKQYRMLLDRFDKNFAGDLRLLEQALEQRPPETNQDPAPSTITARRPDTPSEQPKTRRTKRTKDEQTPETYAAQMLYEIITSLDISGAEFARRHDFPYVFINNCLRRVPASHLGEVVPVLMSYREEVPTLEGLISAYEQVAAEQEERISFAIAERERKQRPQQGRPATAAPAPEGTPAASQPAAVQTELEFTETFPDEIANALEAHLQQWRHNEGTVTPSQLQLLVDIAGDRIEDDVKCNFVIRTLADYHGLTPHETQLLRAALMEGESGMEPVVPANDVGNVSMPFPITEEDIARIRVGVVLEEIAGMDLDFTSMGSPNETTSGDTQLPQAFADAFEATLQQWRHNEGTIAPGQIQPMLDIIEDTIGDNVKRDFVIWALAGYFDLSLNDAQQLRVALIGGEAHMEPAVPAEDVVAEVQEKYAGTSMTFRLTKEDVTRMRVGVILERMFEMNVDFSRMGFHNAAIVLGRAFSPLEQGHHAQKARNATQPQNQIK